MKWRPQRGDGEETMKSNLLVSCRLHPLQCFEFRLELIVVANNRLVIAFLANFVTEIILRITKSCTFLTFNNSLWNVEIQPFLPMFARIRIDFFNLLLLLFRSFVWNHHLDSAELNYFWFYFVQKTFVTFIDQTFHESKFNLSVPLVMDSSDTNKSPYDNVNRFFVFEPSARILGSRSSGLLLVRKLIIDDQTLVDFGLKMGASMIVASDFRSLLMMHGTWIRAYPMLTSVPHMLVPYKLKTIWGPEKKI